MKVREIIFSLREQESKIQTPLNEGGWASTKTQQFKITPMTVKKVIPILKKFEKDFNSFLKARKMLPIKIGSTIGSSKHYEKDLAQHPDKEYGDIDVVFVLPRMEGVTENKITTTYVDLINDFIAEKNPSYLYDDGEKRTGQNIMVKVGDEIHQVDLVKAFYDTEDWTTHRMTPEHGLKGALLGFLYASLAEVLNLSIGPTGVLVKHIGDDIVPFKKIKVDALNTISLDIGNFARHIFDYFYARAYPGKNDAKIPAQLKKSPGMKREEIKFKDLADAIKALGAAFEENDMFGKGDLKNFKNYNEFISKIKAAYTERAEDAMKASKFDKAETETAKARAEETKELLRSKPKELLKLL